MYEIEDWTKENGFRSARLLMERKERKKDKSRGKKKVSRDDNNDYVNRHGRTTTDFNSQKEREKVCVRACVVVVVCACVCAWGERGDAKANSRDQTLTGARTPNGSTTNTKK